MPWADGSSAMRVCDGHRDLLGGDRRGLAQEAQQFAVDLFGVGDAHDVRAAVDLDVAGVGQRGVQSPALAVDRQDPVGGAVQDQGRDVDALDVLG